MKFKQCCGGPNPQLIRVTFHVDPDPEHPGLLALGRPVQRLVPVDLQGDLLEGFLGLTELAFGSDVPAQDLLRPEGRSRFLRFIAEQSGEDGVFISVLFRNAEGGVCIPPSRISDITAARWTDGAPPPRILRDLPT